jgi:predicted hydrocarbon binding protein
MPEQDPHAAPRFEGSVAPAFPLALLESVKAHDLPDEILEDEDLSVSLPRRLGLTGVVETQIMRYEAAQRSRGVVRLDEVMGLFRLVLRRPDAAPILRDTGHRIARWQSRNAPKLWLRLLHRAPHRLGMRAARRNAARTLRELRLGSTVQATKPFTIRLRGSATAAIEGEAPACSFVSAMLEEQVRFFTGLSRTVSHATCEARGGGACEWTLET